ncbi:hypothetical protein RV18_GL002981 [Enterococcus termitis]|nr:hypothetical protein RV18_GL002981 [Enterococcus termitis]
MLATEHISFQHGEQIILNDITTLLEKDSHTTITGPSGRGKSTLFKLLVYLLTPTK